MIGLTKAVKYFFVVKSSTFFQWIELRVVAILSNALSIKPTNNLCNKCKKTQYFIAILAPAVLLLFCFVCYKLLFALFWMKEILWIKVFLTIGCTYIVLKRKLLWIKRSLHRRLGSYTKLNIVNMLHYYKKENLMSYLKLFPLW